MHPQVGQNEVDLSGPFLVLEVLLEFLVEYWVQENLLPVKSFCLISLQAAKDKIFHILAHLKARRKNDFSAHNFLPKPFLSFLKEMPRNLAHQHFIGHDAQRPNVAFMSVFLFIQNLGSHVAGSAN